MKLMNEQHTMMCEYTKESGVPNIITVSSYTTGMEQLRLSSEAFHNVMVNEILPNCVDPKFDINELYEVDYYLLLRRLRLATWGPMFTIGSYYCPECVSEDGTKGVLHKKKKQVRLDSVGVTEPEDGKAVPLEFTLTPDDFIFTNATMTFKMNKCRQLVAIEKMTVPDHVKSLLPLAFSLRTVSGEQFVDISEILDYLQNLPPADFKILQDSYIEAFSYGLNSRGDVVCDECGGTAWFFAPVNDYYFRPSREDLKEWARLLRDTKNSV